MAILHIMGQDKTSLDPVVNERGCFKRGDIVNVKDDYAHDGDIVKNPIAPGRYLVKILGTTRSQLERFIAERVSTIVDECGQPIRLTRRLYKIDLDSLPASIRNTLNRDRYIEVTLAQVRNYIRNKVTGGTE